MTSQDHIDFFWRPGCGFCMALERSLTSAQVPFQKFNIWDDAKHAEFVRSVANGNETVPTLRIGETSLVNPSLGEVINAMKSETPHLVPAGPPPPSRSKSTRFMRSRRIARPAPLSDVGRSCRT